MSPRRKHDAGRRGNIKCRSASTIVQLPFRAAAKPNGLVNERRRVEQLEEVRNGSRFQQEAIVAKV